MRAGAFRKDISAAIALSALILLSGCSSPTKRHYLRHLSIVVQPSNPDRDLAAAFTLERTGRVLAAAPTEE